MPCWPTWLSIRGRVFPIEPQLCTRCSLYFAAFSNFHHQSQMKNIIPQFQKTRLRFLSGSLIIAALTSTILIVSEPSSAKFSAFVTSNRHPNRIFGSTSPHSSTRGAPTQTPSPAPPLSISPKQGQQGKTYTISIRSADCESVNFQKQNYTLLKEENSGVKISGDDNTVDGGCTYTAQLTVDTNAPFGDVILKLKPASGPTLTVAFSIAAIAPGPIPPGI